MTSLKRLPLALGLLGAVVGLLVGCSRSHATEAAELRDQLAGMPGVDEVTLDYKAPAMLENGWVGYEVVMAEEASDDQAVAVVSATYDEFAGAFADQDSTLLLRRGDDVIHLRALTPEPSSTEVEQSARDALGYAVEGRLRARISAFVPEDGSALQHKVRLRLPAGTTKSEAARHREELRKAFSGPGDRVVVTVAP